MRFGSFLCLVATVLVSSVTATFDLLAASVLPYQPYNNYGYGPGYAGNYPIPGQANNIHIHSNQQQPGYLGSGGINGGYHQPGFNGPIPIPGAGYGGGYGGVYGAGYGVGNGAGYGQSGLTNVHVGSYGTGAGYGPGAGYGAGAGFGPGAGYGAGYGPGYGGVGYNGYRGGNFGGLFF